MRPSVLFANLFQRMCASRTGGLALPVGFAMMSKQRRRRFVYVRKKYDFCGSLSLFVADIR